MESPADLQQAPRAAQTDTYLSDGPATPKATGLCRSPASVAKLQKKIDDLPAKGGKMTKQKLEDFYHMAF